MASHSKTNSNSLTGRLRRGGIWIVGGRTLGMAAVLAQLIVLAPPTLPTADFKAFVLASTIVACFSMAAMFGINTLVCRYVAESLGVKDPARARKAIHLAARIAAVSIGSWGLAGGLFVMWLGDALFSAPQLGESAGFIALWIVLLAVSQILAEIFRGLHDLRMASLLGGVTGGLVFSALFLLALLVTSVVSSLDFRSVVVIATASLLAPITLALFVLRRRWPSDASDSNTPEHTLTPLTTSTVAREAFPIMLVQVLSFATAQLDIWIVGVCCSDQDLAVYAVVRRLSLLVAIPLTQISLVVASSISELYAQRAIERLESVLRAAATVAFAASLLVAAALTLCPGLVLDATFGPDFRVGIQSLLILCLGQVAFALTGCCGPALMMTGHQRIALCSLFSSGPLLLLAAPWAATQYGPEAVAVISALAMTVKNVFQWFAVRILLGIRTHPSFSPKFLCSISAAFRPRRNKSTCQPTA